MRLLFDMNFGPRWVDRMRAVGIDAEHWTSLGHATASDERILRLAGDRGWVVVTQDLGFAAILAAAGDDGPSVIQVRRAVALDDALVATIAKTVRDHETILAQGAIVTLDVRSGPTLTLPRHPRGPASS